MNIANLPLTQTPPPISSKAKAIEKTGKAKEGFRLNSPQSRGTAVSGEFWDVIKKMSRYDQLLLSASALVSQVSSNGVNPENENLIKSFKAHFTQDELGQIRNLVQNHALLRHQNAAQKELLMGDLDRMWGMSAAQEAMRPAPTRKREAPLRTPQEIYFQTTLNSFN